MRATATATPTPDIHDAMDVAYLLAAHNAASSRDAMRFTSTTQLLHAIDSTSPLWRHIIARITDRKSERFVTVSALAWRVHGACAPGTVTHGTLSSDTSAARRRLL